VSYDEARAAGPPAFVFTADDPYFFLDLDDCRLPDGSWADHATHTIERFDGACVEESHSGDGLHVFGRYAGPAPEHGTRCADLHAELYTARRFVALGSATAEQLEAADTEHTEALRVFAATYFPPTTFDATNWTTEPREGYTGPTDDDELLRRAMRTESRFGGSATFRQLWDCDVDALAGHYPDPKGSKPYNESSADMALARHLSFWSGANCERVERLMWQSGLVRDKWHRRTEDYLRAFTIQTACGSDSRIYDKPAPAAPSDGESMRTGFQWLTVEGQKELFDGCVYLKQRNKIYMPNGDVLGREVFNASVPSYVFQLDQEGKTSTRKPWEAFTESLCISPPIADDVIFDPLLEQGLTMHHGRQVVNTWRPADVEARPGDIEPFLRHIRNILPVPTDQLILLSYCAALVQHVGVKFKWCPVLQGVEGNGKSLICDVMRYCIGPEHTHPLRNLSLGGRFNDWMLNKILITVDDVTMGPGILERLKPAITDEWLEIESKGERVTANHRIFANFLINTNHRHGVPKTANDRRYSVFFLAQQRQSDLARDGMDEDYFADLFEWLNGPGLPYLAQYFRSFDIPDRYNPAGRCKRAPETSSEQAARRESVSDLSETIADIMAGSPSGLRGPWVSRSFLSTHLCAIGHRVTVRDVRLALTELGYVPHPAMGGRRTDRPVAPDARQAELWVRAGDPAESMGRDEAVEEYERTNAV
jgi:hypothetical protein